MAKLYGQADNFRTQKVLAAAKLANREVQLIQASPPESLSPFGLIPAFEDEKVKLYGAEAISKYLLEQRSHPSVNKFEIDQWMYWGESQLLPNVLALVLSSVSIAKVNEENEAQVKAEFLAQLAVLSNVLLDRTFLVGERLSLADISIAFDLFPAYQYVLGEEARSRIANVTRWFLSVMNQPGIKDVLGSEPKLIKEPAKFNENDYKLIQEKLASTQKLAKQQPTKQDKKAQKKEENKEEIEEADAADEALASQPKFVDPLAALPAGSFVMDGFKRVYSNEDTATKAIPYFWENFDPENYSIWYGEYKYPEELKAVFMSCNLITGMFQRLEKLKKHAFASVCLFGADNNSSISGVWIWRGQKLAFEQSPDWQVDYDVYEWKKLDPKSDDHKKLVNEYLMWEGSFGGKKFNQGKIFK